MSLFKAFPGYAVMSHVKSYFLDAQQVLKLEQSSTVLCVTIPKSVEVL